MTFAGALLGALLTTSAHASVFTFDENGLGTVQTPSGQTLTMAASKMPDPFDPSNGLLPLVYQIPPTVTGIVVQGDVGLIEVAGTPPSDLLRWGNLATGAVLVVYSDKTDVDDTAAADVGLPGTFQPNLIFLQETGPEGGINGLFGYAPTPNQPGYYLNSAGDTPTYNFISDTPEPASAAMLFGSVLLIARRRK
jgi:hypothetical protein